MSNEPIDDGGPAFPDDRFQEGMSLRDYFAAKALVGILAYPGDGVSGSAHNNAAPTDNARYAYQCADAMLAARSKP